MNIPYKKQNPIKIKKYYTIFYNIFLYKCQKDKLQLQKIYQVNP